MARQYCNAEQADTPKLISTLAVLCLMSVAVLTPAGAFSAKQAQRAQLQNIEPTQAPGQRIEAGAVPDGLSNADWASIQGQIAAGKYRAYQHTRDGYVSSNPAHGWQIRYAADGTTTLRPRDRQGQAWHLGLKLSAVGFTEPQTLDRPQQIIADDFTVTYRWNDSLREWWVNTASELEQWFELEQRPAGAQSGQPLTLEMALATDLAASQQGNALRFVNAAGTTISYNKLKAWDANGRELPARMQLAVNTLSLIIDDTDASYPLTIDPSFQQQAYLKASNTDGGDEFGFAVAIAGDTLVVGATAEASNATDINGDEGNNSALFAGAVYVFTRSGVTWSQQAYLKASNTDVGDFFGYSVAISGDTLVVGATAEASNATGINGDENDNSALDSGAVYVFTRSGTSWSQQAYLKASNSDGGDIIEGGDAFGFSVAISGDTLVVGATGETSNATGINGDENDNSAFRAGAAYVFTRSGTTWSQQAYLKASNTGGSDLFGWSVAISGDTLVVSARHEASNATGVNGDQDNNLAGRAGAAYVFTRSGTSWSQQAYLKASNTDAEDRFGFSVAISGDTLVVGATAEDSNATGINGDQSDNSAFRAGAVYVFTRSGTSWSQQAYLKASNTDGGDRFGLSVAISGDTLVVSATAEDSNATGINGDQIDNSALFAGAVYVFTRSGMTWSQQAYLKASNTDGGDNFGQSVAISGDTLVVGATGEASNATGVNEDDSDNSAPDAGAAYVFFDSSGTQTFTINAGLNDAWFNPATAGQGFFIIVFPVIKMMFVAMFTFDTELPDPSTPAMLGAAEHRWFTAFGDYADNQAVLDIEITSDGVFDSPEPVVSQVPDGTLTVEFEDCSTGMITYNIPSIGRQGVIPIQRLADDNEALCEELNTQ